jgi:acyl-CoA synthetase (AMP-forming)/AMP-acid ligase II
MIGMRQVIDGVASDSGPEWGDGVACDERQPTRVSDGGRLEGGVSFGEEWSRAGWRAHLPGVGDPGAFAAGLGTQTILELAAASARRSGDRLAVAVDGVGVTHAGLDADAARAAGWLAGRIDPGDRVLLAAGTSLGFVRWHLGALRAGAVVVLANPAGTAAEFRHLVSDSGARMAFADPGPARRLAGTLPVVAIEDAGVAAAGSAPHDELWPRPGDTALLAYTSGTTGRPKGAPMTHAETAISTRAVMAAWHWSADDVLVHSLPLFHGHGLGGLHATLIAGSSAYLLSKFSVSGLVAAVADSGASVLMAVPTIYQALADAVEPGEGAAEVLRGLRLAVCGSAPLSPELAERLRKVLGQLPLVRYGTTESGLDVSNPLSDPRGDTLGLALPGVLARIWSGDAEAPPGTDGEIQVRGPQVFGGYWHDKEATAAAFTPDGWFRTGDIGAIDPATGHMVIRGRIKELIITGGMNVYPREVELVLERHPSVAEAAVAGVPHEHWGERVTAWVVPRPGQQLDEEALIAHARAELSPYKCPKRVFELDALPRNALGKVLRSELAAGSWPDE